MGRHILIRKITLQKFRHSRKEPVIEVEQPESWDHHDDDEDDCLLNHTGSTLAKHGSEHSFSSSEEGKSVRFGDCEVRAFSQILGDHPCCSLGCPLELGWDYTDEDTVPVDDFQAGRDYPPRTMKELRLSPEERRDVLLLQEEYSDGELRRACRRLSRTKEVAGGKAHKRAQREFFSFSTV